MDKIYYWLLWWWGFADTDGNIQTHVDREKITYMLRRGKERMGLLWWVISLASILGVFYLCITWPGWWRVGWILFEAFLLWLFVHVLYVYKPPDNIWKPE